MAVGKHVIDVDQGDFETEVVGRSYETPVVVDFWAPWCGPCRTLGPLLERLAGEANGAFTLAKVNVDNNPELAMRYGIQGIPAVKAFRDGKVAAEFVGAQPEPMVRRFVKQVAPAEADQLQAQAAQLLNERRWPQAEVAFRALVSRNGGSGASLGLAKSLLGQGRGAEAEQLLADLTTGPEAVAAEALRPLAQLIAEAGGNDQQEGQPELDARLRDAGRLATVGDYAAAMDALLEVLRRDKRYKGDTPRRAMLAIFALLGDGDPLTVEYRRRLASALF